MIVCFAVALGRVHYWILILYLVLSLLAFAMYAIDKSAAKKDRWRTSEKTLHWVALLGGWPGALIAQQTLRHKTQKRSFRMLFWATVVVNVIAFIGLTTPTGMYYWHHIMV
nr:DUF1294 domain-containing protein [Echinimonas agarilytica]